MNPPHNPPPPRTNTASRPPPPSRLPPPRHQPQSQSQPHQTTTEVEQAIARRRAELRRLQAKSSAARPLPGSTPGFTPQNRYGQTSTPVIAPSARDTPSTAAVARRLDNSYGPPTTSNQQSQQQKPPPTKPDLAQFKRTSEIFPRSSHGVTPVAARTRSARPSQPPPPKVTESPVLSSSSPQVAPSRSPFGAARATLVPALPVGDKSLLVPPLILEPFAKSLDSKQHVAPQGSILRNDVKQEETEELKTTLSQIVGTVSGESTPITSNSISTEKTLERANHALLSAQQNATAVEKKSTPPSTTYPNLASFPRNNQGASENVVKQPQRSKSTPSLMDQLNRAVALKGEKAVMGLLEKLEKPTISSPYNPPLTPRGRSMDLLSSMGAPLTPRSRPTSPERWNNTAPMEKKFRSTPLPKGDKLEARYILDASMIISNEYETELVNYVVRAPSSTQRFDDDFFSTEESYRNTFDIDNSDSLEIIAHIEADGSVFELVGKDARHGKFDGELDGEKKWSVFKNIEESDRTLGSVTYIDMDGNEREYWLESIYDEAMSIREAYCTSIRSAACALKHAASTGIGLSQSVPQNNQAIPLTTNNANEPGAMPVAAHTQSPPAMPNQFVPPVMQTSLQPEVNPIPLPREINQIPKEPVAQQEPIQNKTHDANSAPPEQVKKPASDEKQKPKEDPEQFESADSALPLMIVSLFSLFFSIVWFVVFKLPYRVCSSVLTFCVILMSLRVLWLLLADDNGAWDMGAGVDYEYNAPGIY